MKKRYYGIIPAIAAVTLIAGGFASWVFGMEDRTNNYMNVSITDLVEDSIPESIGAFSITNSDYKLKMDQSANPLNSSSKGVYFDGSCDVYFAFNSNAIKSKDAGDTYLKNNTVTMTLTLSVNETLANYVNITYSTSTLTSNEKVFTLTASEQAEWDSNASQYKLKFYSTTSKDSGNTLLLLASYVEGNEPTTSTGLSSMTSALQSVTTAVNIKASISITPNE